MSIILGKKKFTSFIHPCFLSWCFHEIPLNVANTMRELSRSVWQRFRHNRYTSFQRAANVIYASVPPPLANLYLVSSHFPEILSSIYLHISDRSSLWTFNIMVPKAWVALETKLRQVCFDNQKIRQIPVISWPRQVRPTCLDADKNLSTKTNLQKCRRPASEHDFLRTTNKNCFSCSKPVSQFSEP